MSYAKWALFSYPLTNSSTVGVSNAPGAWSILTACSFSVGLLSASGGPSGGVGGGGAGDVAGACCLTLNGGLLSLLNHGSLGVAHRVAFSELLRWF